VRANQERTPTQSASAVRNGDRALLEFGGLAEQDPEWERERDEGANGGVFAGWQLRDRRVNGNGPPGGSSRCRPALILMLTAGIAVLMVGKAPSGDANSAARACKGHEATIVGTPQNDAGNEFPYPKGGDPLHGTPGNDVIVGRGGKDLIEGGRGRDLICGGPGNDWLEGGGRADRIFGGTGRDLLAGIEGGDHLHGEGSPDNMYGGPGGGGIDHCNGGPPGHDGPHGGDWAYNYRWGSGRDCNRVKSAYRTNAL
jgi:hypothetical protein